MITATVEQRLKRAGTWLFAALAYLPMFIIDPGKVEADTKSYLYLDPARLLASAGSMWDPKIGLGTSSHQTIGYLFPLGPYYWLTEHVLGLPAWIAQRFWLGTLVFAAGMGMRYLLRALGISGEGVPVAMLAYAFTPYALEYSARLSVLLGPWAALPWMTAFVIRGLAQSNPIDPQRAARGVAAWKYPALFAVTVQLVSSVNASALIFALIGPALWVLYAVFVDRAVSLRRAWGVTWRTGLLTFVTSLWWIAGLWVEGKYGLNILRFTESIQSVSATSYPFEIIRGLGYWFFYGRDRSGLWNDAFLVFSLNAGVILASLALPALSMLSSAMVRWRHRIFFTALALVGVAIAVGAAPYNHPSLLGAVFKSFATTSTAGFALRSTARATPLVAMSFAVLLAAGIGALARRLEDRGRARVGLGTALAVGVLCLANAAGAWNGSYYSSYLERDEQIPKYWRQALAAVDAQPHDTRVLALPGSDFAAYRWGDTIDPIEPGLIDRPYVARELVPWGSEPSANLLQALDRRVQEGALETDAIAPIARLMGAGDVLFRFDLQTDRFDLIPAGVLWQTITQQPGAGLSRPARYGTTIPGSLLFPELGDLARPPSADPSPPPVAVLHVAHPLTIVRTKAAQPLVVDGDGEGLLDLAGAGLLDARRAVLYAASYQHTPSVLRNLPDGTLLVITDSNRRRGLRWAHLSQNYGYTEQAGEQPLQSDPLDQRLAVFPTADDDARTVTILHGVRSVRATRYGSEFFGYTPGDRPAMALDGDPKTAWLVDDGINMRHERLQIRLTGRVTTDHINFEQPSAEGQRRSRFISKISLRFDGGKPIVRTLDASSRKIAGQTVWFPKRSFSQVEIRFEAVRQHTGLSLGTKNAIGFAEVRIRDDARGAAAVRVSETTRMPRDLLDSLGTRSDKYPLTLVMTRDSTMDGSALARQFTLPSPRVFTLSGTANLSTFAHDDLIDRTIGLPDAEHGGVTATSSARLGDPIARASSALDGDLSTAWNTPIGKIKRVSMRVRVPQTITFDRLDLARVADGRHSLATKLEISSDSGEQRVVTVPASTRTSTASGVARNSLHFAAIQGRAFTFRILGFQPVKRSEALMPAGIAELGIPGVRRGAMPAAIPDGCLSGLLSIDGQPISIRVSGTPADVIRQRPLRFSACEPGNGIALGSGTHRVLARLNPHNPANHTGIDVSRIAISSTPVNGHAVEPGPAPAMRVMHQTRTSFSIRVASASHPYWLVVGESINRGWVAKIDGHDLGPSQLVDGYANGWLVQPQRDGRAATITVEWTPQRVVRLALAVSALGALFCIAVLMVAFKRRRALVLGDAMMVEQPVLRDPGEPHALAQRPLATVAVTALAAISGALLVRPWVGLLVAALVYSAIRDPRARSVIRFAPAAIVAAIAVYISGAQFVQHYPPRFDWPTFFEPARIPTWIALLLLAADALVAFVWKDRDGPR